MSTRAADYADAVLALEDEGASAASVAEGLAATLSRRGHRRLAPGILRELASRLARRERRQRVTLTLARDSDAERYAAEIAGALGELGADAAHDEHIDERIVGGFILESGERRHDASYRRALRSLYRRLVGTSS